jgi:hypothetical protein
MAAARCGGRLSATADSSGAGARSKRQPVAGLVASQTQCGPCWEQPPANRGPTRGGSVCNGGGPLWWAAVSGDASSLPEYSIGSQHRREVASRAAAAAGHFHRAAGPQRAPCPVPTPPAAVPQAAAAWAAEAVAASAAAGSCHLRRQRPLDMSTAPQRAPCPGPTQRSKNCFHAEIPLQQKSFCPWNECLF